MYLHLSDFDHLRDDKTVRFREETVNGVPVIIVCYMISNDDLWQKGLGTETRGPCFCARTGELLSLPFDKFFNVNEKAWTQEHAIRGHTVNSVLDKMDGSMITPAMIGGQVMLKTKKSFTSDVALAANRDMCDAVRGMCEDMLGLAYCPIFEYTTPDNKIVLDYGSGPRFTLIAVRDMVSGEYFDHSTLAHFANEYGVPVVERIMIGATVGDCLRKAETAEGIEGWCIYTDEGIYKVKTKWYIERHHLIDVRERDIAGFVLNETLDDLMPNLIAAEADMTIIQRIEREVADGLASIMIKVDRLGAAAAQIPTGKERADFVAEQAGELSKFVHRAARGIENTDEAIRDFYRQRHLSKFSLRSVGNPNFRNAEETE